MSSDKIYVKNTINDEVSSVEPNFLDDPLFRETYIEVECPDTKVVEELTEEEFAAREVPREQAAPTPKAPSKAPKTKDEV